MRSSRNGMRKGGCPFLPSALFAILIVVSARMEATAGLISVRQEIDIGRSASRRFERQYRIVQDPALNARINGVGHHLVPVCGRTDIAYSFKIAESNTFNALAFPGGFIYVTRGLMNETTEEELAFVLGHELAHVAGRHSVRQIEKALYTQTGLLILVAILNRGNVSEGSMNTVKIVDMIIENKYSRDDEMEADRCAVRFMADAGYDPAHSISLMNKIKKKSGGLPGFLNSFIGSHPLPSERISALEHEVSIIGHKPGRPAEQPEKQNEPEPGDYGGPPTLPTETPSP